MMLRVALAALLVATASPAWADDASFLIVNPGGRGNQSKAQAFLGDLGAALTAAWPPDAGPAPTWTGNYHVTEADALASVRGRRPALALVSPGFFEAHEASLGLEPVAVPVRDEDRARTVQFLVRDGDDATATRLAEGALAGLRIGGQVVTEPDWTRRHVLAPVGDPADVILVPHSRSLAAVRALRSGRVDVALLDSVDWRRLAELGRAEGFVSARSSGPLPEGPAVALVDPGATPEEQARQRALGRAAGRALQRLTGLPEGRHVLERMTLVRFDPSPDPG